jgi:hypothetical protein
MFLTEILVALLIVVLLGYIVFLHIQLVKKNLFIESTLKRLSGIEKNRSAEEMVRFLQEIRKVGNYNAFFTDKLFEEKPMGFLLENEESSRIFIHYTKNENDARNIMREGFMFADSFYKTALPVSKDKLDLMIKHNGRKSFGDYLIILSFSQMVFDHYSMEIEKKGIRGLSVENVLTEKPPYKNDNSDLIYQLSNKFVKGYINHQTGEITRNPDFNPAYDSPMFEKNLQLPGTN